MHHAAAKLVPKSIRTATAFAYRRSQQHIAHQDQSQEPTDTKYTSNLHIMLTRLASNLSTRHIHSRQLDRWQTDRVRRHIANLFHLCL